MLFQNSQIRRKLLPENCTPFSALRRAKTNAQTPGFDPVYAHVEVHKLPPVGDGPRNLGGPGSAQCSSLCSIDCSTVF